MRVRVKRKAIKFSLTFSGTALNVKADKGKIQQVIYNLVDNAIKFSHDNSFIYVTVKEKVIKPRYPLKIPEAELPRKIFIKYGIDFINQMPQEAVTRKGLDLDYP